METRGIDKYESKSWEIRKFKDNFVKSPSNKLSQIVGIKLD